MRIKLFLVLAIFVALASFVITRSVVLADHVYYQNGYYTNLCGSETDASFYNCQAWCDPNNGFCSTIDPSTSVSKYWVYRWACEGQSTGCGENPVLITPSDSLKYLEVARDVSGQPTACNKTVQLDVFDKFCGAPDSQGHFDSWTCAGGPGMPDPNLKGYMVWYSGQCSGTPPPSTCNPSANAHNPLPVNGATGVSLQPTFSWSWDCDPSWVKWTDVFIWNCNPNGDPGCSASKPLSFAHLGPGATFATLSQFGNLPSLNASTNYWWEVVPNSNSATNAVWTFTTAGCSSGSITDPYVAPTNSGPWTNSLTVTGPDVYVKGNNRAGSTPVTVSVTPGVSQIVGNNAPLKVTDTNGLKLGSHSVVSYFGQTNSFCTTPATYTCDPAPLTLTAVSPKNVVSTGPTAYQWTSDFGTDHCGGDYPNDDQLTVTLYSQFNSGSNSCSGAQLGSCPPLSGGLASTTTSCNISNNNWTLNQTYCWRIVANNGVSSTKLDTPFTYNPNAEAWFQTTNGGVYALKNLQSVIPSTCDNVNHTCYFNINTGNTYYPGIVVYDQGSTNFGVPSSVSRTGWLANASFNIRTPTYADFYRQLPVATEKVSNWGEINSRLNPAQPSVTTGADAIYLEYTGSGDLSLGKIDVGNRKVVLYVPAGAGTTVVNINDDIGTILPGPGFFALVTTRPVNVGWKTEVINGLIFTESDFTTLSKGSNSDQPLTVNGSVVSTLGNITLGRSLPQVLNVTTPAEQFNFDPSLIFTMPRGLRRLQYQVNEVPASNITP